MQPVDCILCAGDIVSQYRVSNEALNLIREWGVVAVQGNHEDSILSSSGLMLRRYGSISPENLKLLESLPVRLTMEVDGRRLVMVHISPLDPGYGDLSQMDESRMVPADEVVHDTFVRSVRRGQAIHPAELSADILVVGNTHHQVVRKVGKTLVINPGSIGEPRDPEHPHRRTYALLDSETLAVEIRWFEQAVYE